MRDALAAMNTDTRMRFLRFLAVGGLNTAFGFAVYASLLALGLHYAIAVAVGTVLGVLFNFRTYGSLVFGATGLHRLPRFVSVYAILYLVNVSGIAVLTRAGFTDLLAGLILLIPVALLGYVFNSRFVYGSDRP